MSSDHDRVTPSGGRGTTDVAHHVALRVANMERAIDFYASVFGAEQRTGVSVWEGPLAEEIMGGRPGVRFKVCLLRAGRAGIELFEFLAPVVEPKRPNPTEGGLLHFAIQVDDVGATLAAAEAAGGRRVNDPQVFGGIEIVHLYDPDYNPLELLNASIDDLIALVAEQGVRLSKR